MKVSKDGAPNDDGELKCACTQHILTNTSVSNSKKNFTTSSIKFSLFIQCDILLFRFY